MSLFQQIYALLCVARCAALCVCCDEMSLLGLHRCVNVCVCVWLVHAWRALVCAMVVAFVGVHDVHDGRIACVCCVLVWICDTRCVHIGMGMFAMLLYWLSVGVGCRSVGNHAQTRTFTFWLGSNRLERTSCVFRLCEWLNWIAYLIEILLGYFWLVVW